MFGVKFILNLKKDGCTLIHVVFSFNNNTSIKKCFILIYFVILLENALDKPLIYEHGNYNILKFEIFLYLFYNRFAV